jgi:hypothetical protein
MELEVYLSIEGEHFSPKAFQESLDVDLKGSIEHRKKLEAGVVIRTEEYWKSPVLWAKDHDEAIERIRYLIKGLRSDILRIRTEKPRVKTEVVAHYRDPDEALGFFLPADAILLLAEVESSIDLDEYLHEDGE